MIVCGECGNFYGSKVWHSTSKYRRTVWQCNHKYSNKKKCSTPHLYEEDIKEAFLKVFNHLIKNKEEIIQGYETIIEELMDTSKLEGKAVSISNELQIVEELMRKMVDENAKAPLDQDEYNMRYDELVARYKNAKDEFHNIEEKRQNRKVRKDIINSFIERLKDQETILSEFDESLWAATIENVIVENQEKGVFVFKDETRMEHVWNRKFNIQLVSRLLMVTFQQSGNSFSMTI
jgi:hypothetical protein